MRNKEGSKRFAALAGTTPVPNRVLDEIMPLLSDTQLRVLLVVVRSTLGWQQENGRKERDWLSHRQLQARTGRSSAVVSQAVDCLVQRGLIAVTGAEGEMLLTARARSQSHGRLYYRLTWREDKGEWPGAGTVKKQVRENFTSHEPLQEGTLESEAEGRQEVLPAGESASESKVLRVEATREMSPRKVRTTKETGTKEIKKTLSEVITLRIPTLENEVSRFEIGEWSGSEEIEVTEKTRRVSGLEKAGHDFFVPAAKSANRWEEEATDALTEIDLEVSTDMRRFVAVFRSLYDVKRPGYKMPPLHAEDYALLQRRLAQYPAEELEVWLPAFFECSFGYVRRRGWSLESYLDSLTLLQTAHISKRRP